MRELLAVALAVVGTAATAGTWRALHPSTVAGDAGLRLMRQIVETYHRQGGAQIHFNVFDPEELRDAQRHPEKYENLQVRVCGWNVHWNDLDRREQDAYIRRTESVAR